MKVKLLAAGILFTLPFWACAKDVTIIYTNDLHAHVEPYKVPWIADGKLMRRAINAPISVR
ncbi:5'-nucleotidase [Salmonella enterica]|nr:5'-nucleotidase [Salmonella enterica]